MTTALAALRYHRKSGRTEGSRTDKASMELRQHRNDRDVDQELDREREVEEPKRWPGKHTRTETQGAVDTRMPDVRRVRSALAALRSGGKPLPGALTAEYSKLLGLDLADVRVHHGGAAGDA